MSRLTAAARRLVPAIAMMITAIGAAAPGPEPANADGAFGLYPARDFRLVTGECRDCAAIRQALWYFRDQTIAVPLAGHPIAGFETGVHAMDDVRHWAASARAGNAPIDYPPLVWVVAPDIVRGARLSADGSQLVTHDDAFPFRPSRRKSRSTAPTTTPRRSHSSSNAS